MKETQETWVQSLDQEDPQNRKWQPTPVFLPGKSHGQRSLAGYSPKGRKESDMSEHICILEINDKMYIYIGNNTRLFIVLSELMCYKIVPSVNIPQFIYPISY